MLCLSAQIKNPESKGISLKGTKSDQWEKAGTGQAKIRSSNTMVGFFAILICMLNVIKLNFCSQWRICLYFFTIICYNDKQEI